MNSLSSRALALRNQWLSGVAIAAILALTGCRSLPNVQPFADSTTQIRNAVSATGQAAVAEIALIEAPDQEPASPPTTPLARKFYDNWLERETKLAALDSYAASLLHLVQSGAHGAESAKALAQSVSGLASAVSKNFPAGDPAVQALTSLAADVYGMIAREVAAQKLEKAILAEDPVIQRIGDLLARDLLDLKRLARQDRNQTLSRLAFESKDLPRLKKLEQTRIRAMESLDLNKTADQATLKALSELIELETKSPWYADYNQRHDEIVRTFEAQNGVLDQAVLALKAWASAHHQIGVALQQRQPPALSELQQVSSDLLAAYQAFQKKQGKGD